MDFISRVSEIYLRTFQLESYPFNGQQGLGIENEINDLVSTLTKNLERFAGLSSDQLLEFHQVYPSIIGSIFGTKELSGWASFMTNSKPGFEEIFLKHPNKGQMLRDLLDPKNLFIQLVIELSKHDKFYYYLAVDSLPPYLARAYSQDINTLPLSSKLTVREVSHTKLPVKAFKLNAIEYFLMSLVLNPFNARNTSNYAADPKGSFYMSILKRWLEFFFPTKLDNVEVTGFIRQGEFSSLIICTAQRCFMEMLFAFWMDPYSRAESIPHFADFMQEKASIGISDMGLVLVEELIGHLSKGAPIIFTDFNSVNSNDVRLYTKALWENLFTFYQPKLYTFFKYSISSWPVNTKFIKAIDIWSQYLTPWRMGISASTETWEMYIVNNYLFYSIILLELLQRSFNIQRYALIRGHNDLVYSSELALLRTMNLFSDLNLLRVLSEADAALQVIDDGTPVLEEALDLTPLLFNFPGTVRATFLPPLKSQVDKLDPSLVKYTSYLNNLENDWKLELYRVMEQTKEYLKQFQQPHREAEDSGKSIFSMLSHLFNLGPAKPVDPVNQPLWPRLSQMECQTILDTMAKIFVGITSDDSTPSQQSQEPDFETAHSTLPQFAPTPTNEDIEWTIPGKWVL